MANTAVTAPPHWRASPKRVLLASPFVLPLIPLLARWAVGQFSAGYHLLAFASAALSLVIGLGMVVALAATFGLARGRVHSDADGLTVAPARWLDITVRVLCILVTAAAVAGVVLWWRGDLAVLHLESSRRGGTTTVGIMSVIVAAAGLFTAPRWFSTSGVMGEIRLTPATLTIINGGRTTTVGWDDIAAISDDYGARRQIACPLVVRLATGRSRIVNLAAFSSDPAELYWLLEHYWRNPADRAQLAIGHAAVRLAGREFSAAAPLAPAGH